MRALVISDTHFGAWTGEPLLQHEWARRRIGDALEDVDELVLLSDLFDFLFSSVEDAFAQADGFFSLLDEKMEGKRIVFSCGNHDHHIVVRDLRTAVELKVITGNEVALAEALAMERNFFQRFLDGRLPGVESVISYPIYQVGDVPGADHLAGAGADLDALRAGFCQRRQGRDSRGAERAPPIVPLSLVA
jgi:hypothetical protein